MDDLIILYFGLAKIEIKHLLLWKTKYYLL